MNSTIIKFYPNLLFGHIITKDAFDCRLQSLIYGESFVAQYTSYEFDR